MENNEKRKTFRFKTGLSLMLIAPLFAVAPFLVGAAGAAVFCGPGANEANCGFGVLPWFMFFTIPAGALMFIVGLVILLVSLAKKISN
jgi:hypothetical protein